MDKEMASERLRALASDDSKRSKAARLRDVVDEVEGALAAGVHRADVVAELASLGLVMSVATFDTTLKRLRRARRQPSWQDIAPSAPGAKHPPLSAAPSHRPEDLDQIFGHQPDLDGLAKLAKKAKK